MTTADDHLLAGAYALGALDAANERAFEAHLQACEACRAEVAELTETAAMLAAATPAPVDRALADRVMAQIRSTPQLPAVARGSDDARAVGTPLRGPTATVTSINGTHHAGARRARGRPWLAAAAATLVVLALAGGLVAGRIAGERAQQAEIAAVVDDPATRHTTLGGRGAGEVLVHLRPGTGDAVVEARGMAPLDASRTYELWFMVGEVPFRATTFDPDESGSTQLRFTAPVSNPDAFGVTVERAGGADRPTPPIILQAGA